MIRAFLLFLSSVLPPGPRCPPALPLRRQRRRSKKIPLFRRSLRIMLHSIALYVAVANRDWGDGLRWVNRTRATLGAALD